MSATPDPPPLPATANCTGSWRWAIYLLIIAPLPVLVGVLSLRRHRNEPALAHSASGLLVVCGLEFLVFALIYGGAWLITRASREELFLRWKPGFWVLPLGIGYSVAIRLVVGMFMIAVAIILVATHAIGANDLQKFSLENRPKVETLVDVHALQNNPLYFWLNITLVSFVLGGLREELWRGAFLGGMRALWPRTFGTRGGQIVAVAIGAILFGLGHLPQGALAAGMITLVGLALGIILVVHQSIWPAVIAHGAFDATSMALLPKAMEWMETLRHLH